MTAPAYKERTKTGKLKWRPKEWRSEYNRIVAYSALGKSNVEIAMILDFTKEHVSSILNMPEAKELMEKLKSKMLDSFELNIPKALNEIVAKSVQRIKTIIEDDDLFTKRPFEVAKLGVDVMKGVGQLRGGGNGAPQQPSNVTNNTQNIVLAPSQKSDIMAGFQMIAEVKKLNPPQNVKSDTDPK